MKPVISFLLQIGICTLGCLYTTGNNALAQVTPDNTVNTQVNQNGNVSEITGGETRGDNLFHSFREFSVITGNEAFFDNAATIENIFSRVTGGNVSNIDGLIRANGAANLFLINPAGIIFGENARLDIGGSFLGSTADSILFPDGVEFSATDTQPQPILTINAPIGLNFRDNPEEIVNRAGFTELENEENIEEAGLEVNRGEAITLVGGNINLENGRLTAPGGRIELGGLSEAGTIGFNEDFSLNFSDELTRADVNLTGLAEIDVTSGGGGDISIFANNINVLDGSDICAGIGADGSCGGRNTDFGSVDAQAGDINFNAIETITIEGDISEVNNNLNINSVGNAGNINIETGSLIVRNGGRINTRTFGQGDAGNLTVDASEEIALTNGDIFAQVREQAVGTGGNVTLNTPNLSLREGSQISTSTSAEGDAGDLTVNATELVEVLGTEEPGTQSSIGANVFGENGMGNAGNLTIETKKLVIRSSQVSSSTSAQGDAGNLTVNASESVEITGKVFSPNENDSTNPIRNPAGLFSQVNSQGEGNGGNLTVETPRLSVGDGGKIQVAVFGKGNAGNLSIHASDIDIYDTPGEADFFEGGIFAGFQVDEDQTIVPPQGDSGGTITIETDRLRVRDGGAVTVFTEGNGNAGNLEINAQDSIEVYGEVTGATTDRIFTSKISGEATADSTGSSGSVILDTDKLIVRDRGKVTVSSENTSQPAGNLDITANSLDLNRGSITAETRVGQGEEGANITLKVSDLLTMENESLISAEAFDTAEGGNIDIDTKFLIAFPPEGSEGSDIIANAVAGQGGEINIVAESLFGIEERPQNPFTNDIDASSDFNLDGTVSITTSEVDALQGVTELPSNVITSEQTTAQACSTNRGSVGQNSLVVKGRGGIPPTPDSPLNSEIITINGKPVIPSSHKPKIKPISTRYGDIVPARGVEVTEDGRVILTPYPTDRITRVPNGSANCDGV